MAARNMELDAYLGAYNYELWELWQDSTKHIDQALLCKLVPDYKMVPNTLLENKMHELREEELQMKVEILANCETDEFAKAQTAQTGQTRKEAPVDKFTRILW